MPDASPSLRLALALLDVSGVGRATVHRVLGHASGYDALLALPREQLLHRLTGVPRAAALADLLHEPARFADHLAAADRAIEARRRQRVTLLWPGHPDWPRRLDRLPAARRPVVLHAYGATGLLRRPLLALLGQAGLDPDAFETAQRLAAEAHGHGATVLAALDDGFDVATLRRAGTAAVAVASAGLSRIAPPLRPVVLELGRGGGLVLSPFAMEHGPFGHDQSEACRIRAALATAAVFLDPAPGSHLLRSLERHASGEERLAGRAFALLKRAQVEGAEPLDEAALWEALA